MLKRKKIAYYYDTDDCNYHKAGFDWKIFGWRMLSYGLVSIVLCSGFYLFYTNRIEKIKQEQLMAEHQYFLDRLIAQNHILDNFDVFLTQLYEKDNEIYTSILSANKIQQSTWEGAKGAAGSAVDSSLIHSTGIKIDEVYRRVNLLRENYIELQKLAKKLSSNLDNMPAILPISGHLISGFGSRRHPITGHYHIHTGLDFACGMGTPVYATGNGKIITAEDESNGYGLNVDINHGNGYETKYAHLSAVKVKVGQEVKRGDLIAYSGNSGMSTGPHLHYEIKTHGTKIDPLDFFYTDLSPAAFLKMKIDAKKDNATMDY